MALLLCAATGLVGALLLPLGRDGSGVPTRIEHLTCRFAAQMPEWINPRRGELVDRWKRHYAEGYAPATGALVAALAGQPALADQLLDRCALILLNDESNAFARTFVHHYALQAYRHRLATATPARRAVWAYALGTYKDPLIEKPVNTNCAALQVGSELLCGAAEVRQPDYEAVSALLALVERQQMPGGFINDDLHGDLAPIAYHIFTTSLLVNAAEAARACGRPDLVARLDATVARAVRWLAPFIAPDGMPAQAERSSYHVFTWGCTLQVLAYSGCDADGALSQAVFARWLPAVRSDGSVAVTPTQAPAWLLSRQEPYANEAMYDTLCFAHMALAAELWQDGPSLDMGGLVESLWARDGVVSDDHAGYARRKAGQRFRAWALRRHDRVPAGETFYECPGGRQLWPPQVADAWAP